MTTSAYTPHTTEGLYYSVLWEQKPSARSSALPAALGLLVYTMSKVKERARPRVGWAWAAGKTPCGYYSESLSFSYTSLRTCPWPVVNTEFFGRNDFRT